MKSVSCISWFDRQRCRYHLRTNLETGMWLTRESIDDGYETPEWLREHVGLQERE